MTPMHSKRLFESDEHFAQRSGRHQTPTPTAAESPPPRDPEPPIGVTTTPEVIAPVAVPVAASASPDVPPQPHSAGSTDPTEMLLAWRTAVGTKLGELQTPATPEAPIAVNPEPEHAAEDPPPVSPEDNEIDELLTKYGSHLPEEGQTHADFVSEELSKVNMPYDKWKMTAQRLIKAGAFPAHRINGWP